MRRVLGTIPALSLCGTLLFIADTAHAAPETEAVRADALFERGKSEMAAGHTTSACVLFAESYAVEASEGTLLALGLCHEKEGRPVEAFAELRDVHASALKSKREDRQRVARAALGRIEPRIGRVIVRAESPCDQIDLDNLTIVRPNIEMPVSPGHHHVTCTRTHRWEQDIDVAAGALAVVVVPVSAPVVPVEPAATPPPPPPPPVAQPNAQRDANLGRTLGWVAGALGIASLGVGTFFGVRAFDQWGEAENICPEPSQCRDRRAESFQDNASTAAMVSNITIVAGAVLVGAAVYIIATSPSRGAPARSAWSKTGTLGVVTW